MQESIIILPLRLKKTSPTSSAVLNENIDLKILITPSLYIVPPIFAEFSINLQLIRIISDLLTIAPPVLSEILL